MYKFPKFISKFISILQNTRMSNLVILKPRHSEHKTKFEKKNFFRSEIGIFDIFFKRLCKESFEDLEFNSNWKFQTRAALWPLKFFANLHKSPLLIASIVKGAVSGLRQFLATESPWKIMKNAFYFILTN